jgi:DNA-directed RNA polymerase specialized sigma24 family protein
MRDRQGEPDDVAFEGLVRSAASDDVRAFPELVSRLREPLLRRIRWMMGDEVRRIAESGDFLHATFTAALRTDAPPSFANSEELLRWLTTIARNKIREELRHHREDAVSNLSLMLSMDGARGSRPSWDVALDLAELGEALGCSARHAQRVHAGALIRLARSLRR